MTLKTFLENPAAWLDGKGPAAEIVISSRLRLARNIVRMPFTCWAKEKYLREIISLIKDAIKNNAFLPNATIVDLEQADSLIRQFLVERHLISPEHAKSKIASVVIGDKESVNIMVNEEDHLRIQTFSSGLQLNAAWDVISKIDDRMSEKIEYAFSSEWGYLTACPTNVGTGLRASVMIHLPALSITKQIGKILQAVSHLGLAIRGLYGEGTESSGNLFQISNQVTLGRQEEEILDNVEKITQKIIHEEQSAREQILKQSRVQIEDRVYRAMALLCSARIISAQEVMELLSAVRLGVGLNLLNIPIKILNELLISVQPAHIQILVEDQQSPIEKDMVRARVVQKKIMEGMKNV
ncbi:protein arginine kinase [Candidatus Desantisbacteria bacterium CG_4_10_14_3_um_filter_40_18]|uniref:Protein-arginine kinase n=1 Tax=Candidatus Desantisbacteria bacterium CG_4_10_14_3_um_filter_40_18 TaxID=1974544 RepID=A0A2M7P0U9_9BACT|nr:MAG: protein arginine kinase [Candidatus Desantisbacteria bacterium CG_4_10_14_3_um_filter_40_18]